MIERRGATVVVAQWSHSRRPGPRAGVANEPQVRPGLCWMMIMPDGKGWEIMSSRGNEPLSKTHVQALGSARKYTRGQKPETRSAESSV